MARVLVHYDIADAAFRTAFNESLVEMDFKMVTESVYEKRLSLMPGTIETSICELNRAAKGAPPNTDIYLEYPVKIGIQEVAEILQVSIGQ